MSPRRRLCGCCNAGNQARTSGGAILIIMRADRLQRTRRSGRRLQRRAEQEGSAAAERVKWRNAQASDASGNAQTDDDPLQSVYTYTCPSSWALLRGARVPAAGFLGGFPPSSFLSRCRRCPIARHATSLSPYSRSIRRCCRVALREGARRVRLALSAVLSSSFPRKTRFFQLHYGTQRWVPWSISGLLTCLPGRCFGKSRSMSRASYVCLPDSRTYKTTRNLASGLPKNVHEVIKRACRGR